MNTKFRFRGSALCFGLVLATALSVQSVIAAEPKPASPIEILPANILSNVTATTVEQIVNLCPVSHRSAPFTKIRQHDRSGDQVITGRTYTLRAGESSEGDVVVIHGHARVDGVVNGDLALIGSDAVVTGTINGDMIAVASQARFEEGAVVNGDFSSVVSAVEHDKDLQVNGSRYNLDFLPASTATNLGQWLTGTIFFLRPMSPDSFISWFWALLVLGLCLAIGHFFPKPVAETGAILRGRAPASVLCGLAIVPAAALLCFLLLMTVIGAVAIPLVIAAVFALAVVGNAVVFQLIGQRIAPQMSNRKYPALIWIALGAVICWVVYCIPVIGFLAGSIVLLAGLGSFTLYLIDRSKNRVPVAQLPAGTPVAVESPKPTAPAARLTAPLAVARTMPSVTFWPRLGANAIDLVIIFALISLFHVHRVFLPAWVLYRFAMYVWRSATIGELALNLRVQRFDGTLITGDYGTAVVRALSSLLSLLPLGLGFFWTLFDPARETWHDKITNTQVVSTRPTAPPPPPTPPAPPAHGPEAGPTQPPPPPAPTPGSGPSEPPLQHKPESGPTEPPPAAPKPDFTPVEPPLTEHKPEGSGEEPHTPKPESGPGEQSH
ncbi:MAG: RDD family protein [Verrucomicrobia bacterium]|nr:RDD family protein [Verrucomicrobiota bacterium]MBV8484166.1 RDD family protein [Verrucomicrobiota bacterium]